MRAKVQQQKYDIFRMKKRKIHPEELTSDKISKFPKTKKSKFLIIFYGKLFESNKRKRKNRFKTEFSFCLFLRFVFWRAGP